MPVLAGRSLGATSQTQGQPLALVQRALPQELCGWGDQPLIAECSPVPGLKLFPQRPWAEFTFLG